MKRQARIGRSIEMVYAPRAYKPDQLDRAVKIAALLRRGTFVYCEPPRW
jgi:hypothetical protein